MQQHTLTNCLLHYKYQQLRFLLLKPSIVVPFLISKVLYPHLNTVTNITFIVVFFIANTYKQNMVCFISCHCDAINVYVPFYSQSNSRLKMEYYEFLLHRCHFLKVYTSTFYTLFERYKVKVFYANTTVRLKNIVCRCEFIMMLYYILYMSSCWNTLLNLFFFKKCLIFNMTWARRVLDDASLCF